MTITHSSKKLVAIVAGVALAVALVAGVFAAPQAKAALSASQVSAIISLLQSFGADASTIANVQASLTGGTPSVPSSGGSGTACYAWTRSLTDGSSGDDVKALQMFLNSNAATQVAASGVGSPGAETMYFGSLTTSAVAKFQAANGISPTAGYFGPVTRAAVAAKCAPSTPGTPGTPGTPDASLQGSAGTASITTTSTDVEDEVLTGQTEKVLGFKVEASGSDIRATNIRVKFTQTNAAAAASDRLSNYANKIKIYADGVEIGSMNASDFTRDSAGIYSASIPVSSIVRMGSGNKVTFHVGLMANASIDSDDVGSASSNTWTADLIQFRYNDATGAVLFDTTAITNTLIYVTRLSSSTDVKLRMGDGASNPNAGNREVSESNSTEIVLAELTLKAEGADMQFDRFLASTSISGATGVSTIASDFYLMRGSSKLAEVAATTGTAQNLSFSLDDTEYLSMGSTKTYRIVAKIKSIAATSGSGSAFDQGDTIAASTSVDVWRINAKATVDGKSVTERSGSVTTYTQTLYSKGIQVTKGSTNVTVSNNATTPASSFGTFEMNVVVAVFGSDDVYIPLTAASSTSALTTDGATYYIQNSAGNPSVSSTTGATSATFQAVSGGTEVTGAGGTFLKISGGQSATIKLTASFNPDNGTSAGQYRLQLVGVGHQATTGGISLTAVSTTPVEDFRTNYSSQIDN